MSRWLRDHRWAVAVGVLALVAGVALRWWILGTALGVPDLDESTVGIQADQFSRGSRSAFFLNQAYGGTLETALVAMSFKVFGSGVLSLKVIPLALALLAAVLTRMIAVQLQLNKTAQWCAPVLVWCGPAFAVLFSTKERGFYGVALVLAAAYPLLALRLAERANVRDALLLGMAIGLGWWQTPLTFLVAVPAVIWLLCVRPQAIRDLWWSLPAALVAAGPWFVWNANNEWGSLHWTSGFGTTWWDRFFDWLLRLQVVTGMETPFDADRQLIPTRWAGLVVLVVVLAVATVRTNWEAPWFLVTMIGGYGLLYAVNGLAAGVGEDPRYTYLMVPMVAVSIGAVLPDAPTDRLRALAVVGVGALAVATTTWGLVGMRDRAEQPRPNRFLASPGIEEVTERLQDRGIEAVITDTSGMQITFLSDHEVIAGSFAVPRSREFEFVSRSADPSTYVLDATLYGNADRLRTWMDANDVGYIEEAIGRFRIFSLDRRVPPGEPQLKVFGGRLSSRGPLTFEIPDN